MKISIKKNNLSRVALLATLITMTNGYIDAAENETTMQSFGTFVFEVERKFTEFFDQKNKTPFAIHITTLEKLFNDFKRKVEEIVTRGGASDEITKEINDLIDYAVAQFNIAYNIMKKYNGRPSSEAATFGTEIKRDFNTERVFGQIVAKLKVIKCKAEKNKQGCLVEKIEAVARMIEKKRKEWGAKSDFTLLTGLTYRMNCK